MFHVRAGHFAVIFGIILLSACGGAKKEGGMEGSVSVDGSSTVYPITEAIAEEFRLEHPHVKISVGVSGTGGGFKKFGRGEIDINDASRPIKDPEAAACREANISYAELTVAFDGLVVVVNRENTWVNDITVEELKKIWEPAAQKTITRWNQIRPEWPDHEFNLYGPGVASGTYDYFTEAVVGKSGESRGDFTASEDDNVLVQGIEGDRHALGFFGLAYYEENKERLKLVGVDGGKGVIKPSAATVRDGSYSPLSRPVFIYVTQNGARRPEVKAFVEFYLTYANELVTDVGYIPLPEDQYKAEAQEFAVFAGNNQQP